MARKLKGVPVKKNPKLSAALKGNDNAKGNHAFLKTISASGAAGGAGMTALMAKAGMIGTSKAAFVGAAAAKGAIIGGGATTGATAAVVGINHTLHHIGGTLVRNQMASFVTKVAGHGILKGGATAGKFAASKAIIAPAIKAGLIVGAKTVPGIALTHLVGGGAISGALAAKHAAEVYDQAPSLAIAGVGTGVVLGAAGYGAYKGVKAIKNKLNKGKR